MAVVTWTNPIGESINFSYNTLDNITKILAEPKVLKYLTTFNWKEVKVSDAGIVILNHIMFGPNVGFVFLNMNCIDRETNSPIPSIVLIRGDSVACLILIRLFWYQVRMTDAEILSLYGKKTGAAEENECIKVYPELFTWDNILNTHDSKAIAAAAYFAQKYRGVI
jgi:hypothetical protein